jgi:hypothetical protein
MLDPHWTSMEGAMSDGLWGFLGVITGVFASSAVGLVRYWFTEGRAACKRKAGLKKMLDTDFNDGWRKITTLARVIGADENVTRNLLLEIDARGSEKEGSEKWALISRHPIPAHSEED